jgi:hypothetical protein
MPKKIIIPVIIVAVVVIGAAIWAHSFFINGTSGYQTKAWVESARKDYCKLWGGTMVDTGCGIAACTSKCSIPYRDAGKACESSSQCSGKCVITSQQLAQCRKTEAYKYDCTDFVSKGACQKKMLENCQYDYEFNRGTATQIGNCML